MNWTFPCLMARFVASLFSCSCSLAWLAGRKHFRYCRFRQSNPCPGCLKRIVGRRLIVLLGIVVSSTSSERLSSNPCQHREHSACSSWSCIPIVVPFAKQSLHGQTERRFDNLHGHQDEKLSILLEFLNIVVILNFLLYLVESFSLKNHVSLAFLRCRVLIIDRVEVVIIVAEPCDIFSVNRPYSFKQLCAIGFTCIMVAFSFSYVRQTQLCSQEWI